MRVVYLHQYFRTPDMSGGTRSYEMARRLVRRGWHVDLITSDQSPDPAAPTWRTTDVDGITVHWTPVSYSNRMDFGARVGAFLRFAWRSARRAASIPADVIFASSTPLTIALPAAWAASRQGVPMVFEVRDLWPELPIAVGALRSPLTRGAAVALERFAYARASHIVALSEGMKAGVARAGYPAERVTVIPNSCDTEMFDVPPTAGESLRRELPWLGSRPLVLYAGTVGSINGVGYLVRVAAAAHTLAPEVRFAVVGDGRELAQVRAAAEQAGVLGSSFHLIPAVPKREMSRWLSAATLATSLFMDLPAMWSNSANKFFDALAAGRPVMLNYEGWQADLVRTEGAGFAVPPTDATSAAALLTARLADGAWLKSARASARRLAYGAFSRDLLAQQLGDVLEHAARDPRSL